jgi:hypothetical protein
VGTALRCLSPTPSRAADSPGVAEHLCSGTSSPAVCAWSLLEIVQRGLPCPYQGGLRRRSLVDVLQEATLLHDVREAQEQRLIGTEEFPYQHEAQ